MPDGEELCYLTVARVADCAAERERTPNLLAVDYYDRGETLEFVAELNSVEPG